MARLTQQQQSIAYCAQVANYMQQLRTLQTAITGFLATASDQSYDGILQVLPTFAFNANGSPGPYDTSAGTGTVNVTNGATSLTFSSSQTGLTGTYITVGGDATNGLYLVGPGSGTAWVLMSNYNGATNTSATFATSSPNTAHPIALPIGAPVQMARNNVLTANGCLTNFISYMTGVAISTQANTPQKFADLLNS